jgi:hypothetical protein
MTEQEVLEKVEYVLEVQRESGFDVEADAVHEFKRLLNDVHGSDFCRKAEQIFPDGLFDTILDRVLSSEDQLVAIQETISNPFWV